MGFDGPTPGETPATPEEQKDLEQVE